MDQTNTQTEQQEGVDESAPEMDIERSVRRVVDRDGITYALGGLLPGTENEPFVIMGIIEPLDDQAHYLLVCDPPPRSWMSNENKRMLVRIPYDRIIREDAFVEKESVSTLLAFDPSAWWARNGFEDNGSGA